MKRVAITGLGVVSPLGNSIDVFWHNLCLGMVGIGDITHFDASSLKARLAAEVKDFRPEEFGIDNYTARRTDLFTQYALAAVKQAMEQSGIEGKVAPERLGVYVGSGIGGMGTFLVEAKKMFDKGGSRVSPLFIPMMIANIAAGNIAIQYNAQGPCLPVVTACATSTHTIGEAYRAISHGYADAIIAGGSEATINELAVGGFMNLQALSTETDPTKASIPFDRRRKGFVIGEGAGMVVLEEMEHAKCRGAKIFAELCGYSNTCDAYHITAPRADASSAARAIAETAKQACLSDKDVLYINAHGTGTPMNDSAETLAIKQALGEQLARGALVSSTKSMTGHMLGAAGGIEAVICALSLYHGIIPPTMGYEEKDPECDLDYVPNQAREIRANIAFSNSLGFGGHNGCIALRQFC